MTMLNSIRTICHGVRKLKLVRGRKTPSMIKMSPPLTITGRSEQKRKIGIALKPTFQYIVIQESKFKKTLEDRKSTERKSSKDLASQKDRLGPE